MFLLPSQNSGGGGGRNVGLGLQVALSVAAACPNSSLSAVRFCSVLLTDSISSDSWFSLKWAAMPAPLPGRLLLLSLSLLTPLSEGEAEEAFEGRVTMSFFANEIGCPIRIKMKFTGHSGQR